MGFDFQPQFDFDFESAFRAMLLVVIAIALFVALAISGLVKVRPLVHTLVWGVLFTLPVAILVAALASDLPGLGVGIGIFLLVLWSANSAAEPTL